MRTKYSELRQVQSRIDASLHLLTTADHSSSSDPDGEQPAEDMELEEPSQAIKAHREELVKQAEVLRKPSNFIVHSLPKHSITFKTSLP